jgi:hypothetical protein
MNAPTNKQHPDQELIDALLPKLRELQRRVREGTIDPSSPTFERIRVTMEQCLEQFLKSADRPNPPLS